MTIKLQNDLHDLAFSLSKKGLEKEASQIISLLVRLSKESPVKPNKNDMSEFSNDGNFMTALNFGKVLTLAGGLHKEMDSSGNLSNKAYTILADIKNRIDTIMSSRKKS